MASSRELRVPLNADILTLCHILYLIYDAFDINSCFSVSEAIAL